MGARRGMRGVAAFALVAACAGGDRSPSPARADAGAPESAAPPRDASAPDPRGSGDGGGGPADAGPVRAAFGLDTRPSNPSNAGCHFPARPVGNTPVRFERVYANLALGTPMVLTQRPGDASRWYVAQRDGHLEWFASQAPSSRQVVADLSTLAQPVGGCLDRPCVTTLGEGGFLGLAFHPRFADSGRVYVSFTAPQWTAPNSTMRSVIAELTSLDGGDTFTGYRTLLVFDNLEGNHKGGGLAFGPDGYLYATFGDGGSLNDAFAKGQTKDGFFSKVLRLDVDGPRLPGREYGVPRDNPFVDGGGEPAVFAWGFRNPFRISVDRASNEVWVGDVGQESYEEIDRVEIGGNYGWSCRQGAHGGHTHPILCPDLNAGFRDPIVEHAHGYPSPGKAVIGGVVYRGRAIPGFEGTYVYGDYMTQELFALTFDSSGGPVVAPINESGPRADWVSFAEDSAGEVYAVALSGAVYALRASAPAPPAAGGVPERLSLTGCVDPSDPQKPAPGLVPFAPSAPAWNDGAVAERWLALPDGATIALPASLAVDAPLELPIGSVVLEELGRGSKPIETRVLARDPDGSWAGYSYEWNEAGTDATLLSGSKLKATGAGESWYFPSRAECARCHAGAGGAGGGTLGLVVGQLNGDAVYRSTNRIANQLATFDHLQLFAPPLAKAGAELAALGSIPSPTAEGPLEPRARAWLHANCAGCHRPGGIGPSVDLRFSRGLGEIGACNVDPSRGTLGVANAKLLAPGDPARSLLYVRPRQTGANRMPPLGARLVDATGLGAVESWIGSLTGCP